MVDHGVNIPAVCRSIVSEVRYMVCQQTQTQVDRVNVMVDSIVAD